MPAARRETLFLGTDSWFREGAGARLALRLSPGSGVGTWMSCFCTSEQNTALSSTMGNWKLAINGSIHTMEIGNQGLHLPWRFGLATHHQL